MPPDSGCQKCTDADPATAWERASGLEQVRLITDESHFIVSLRRCSSCSQRYASVFCETIDWVDGDDPQDWLLIPVSKAEAQSLVDAGEAGVGVALGDLSPRRYLRRWSGGTDGAMQRHWASGDVILPPYD